MTKLNLLVFLFVSCFSFSQKNDFSVALIPVELKGNANSVVRFDDHAINIESQRSMTIKVEKAITIYNKLADRWGDITLQYDKRRIIKNVKMIIFDKMGNEVRKVKRNEFKDYSASDGMSLYNDARLIHYDYTPVAYPYTVYVSYEIKTSNTAFIPSWIYQSNYYQSIQNSNFSITHPSHIKLIKSERNFKGYDVKKTETFDSKGESLLSYQVENCLALEREPYTPKLSDVLPYSKIGVNRFNLEGVDGTAKSWQEFGKWYYDNLIKGRLSLSEETKLEVLGLTQGIVDPVEKTKIVYKYVQDKVRYISIQVGIGGFMPMLASDVDKLGYGDCKGLTNYTAALLKVVGIDSYHTLIFAGRESKTDVNKDVFSQQGNHMILNVPVENKDLWLECTSQKTPFADGGDFTDDRDVLIISSDGGQIKHTRVYKDDENQQNIKAKYNIDVDGNIGGEVNMVSSGTQFDNHLYFEGLNAKELDKQYKEFWDNIDNMTIEEVVVENNKEEGRFEESISFKAENYGTLSGERMIFPVNAFNVINKAPKRIRNRKLPVEVVRGFYDVDEVEIELPDGFDIEAKNEDIMIDSKYGSYTISIEKKSEKVLTYKREFLLKAGNYPKEEYADYRNFWKQVARNDNAKIVLIKK